MAEMIQRLVLQQGAGHFMYLPGQTVTVPIEYDGPSSETLAVIANALRSGAGAVQAIGTVAGDLMETIEEKLLPLQEREEAFLITQHAAYVRIARKLIKT